MLAESRLRKRLFVVALLLMALISLALVYFSPDHVEIIYLILALCAEALSFLACSWIIVALPYLRPSAVVERRLFPRQILQVAYANIVMVIAYTVQDFVEFGGMPQNKSTATLICQWLTPFGLMARTISFFTNVHTAIMFVCWSFELQKLIKPMSCSLPWLVLIGIVSGLIECFLVGGQKVHFIKDDKGPRRCEYSEDDVYGLVVMAICFCIVVIAFIAVTLKAWKDPDDALSRSVYRKIFSYLVTFLMSFSLVAILGYSRHSVNDKPPYLIAMVLEHLNGFFNVFTYSIQSKLCHAEWQTGFSGISPSEGLATPSVRGSHDEDIQQSTCSGSTL
eukprot:TRINITY_DN68288_c0_g1_i1.p1 TRINITY_DN68288_c0_g1~~TRINITY_DN68288_c0_g1_i1.p1  ORF type:complete len:368 (+),score=18.77 TRINITY_DN68288_c0_g1_i1:102-1106(+)